MRKLFEIRSGLRQNRTRSDPQHMVRGETRQTTPTGWWTAAGLSELPTSAKEVDVSIESITIIIQSSRNTMKKSLTNHVTE